MRKFGPQPLYPRGALRRSTEEENSVRNKLGVVFDHVSVYARSKFFQQKVVLLDCPAIAIVFALATANWLESRIWIRKRQVHSHESNNLWTWSLVLGHLQQPTSLRHLFNRSLTLTRPCFYFPPMLITTVNRLYSESIILDVIEPIVAL